MKVGLFLGNQLAEVGGGYTFENEILQALIKLEASSRHTFVLYSWSKKPPQEISLAEHIQFISFYRNFKERLISKLYRTIIAALKKIQNPTSQLKIEGWYEKYILNLIVTNDIDITWSLVPGCLTTQVPYITVVWDLQHQLQPYFPEVSAEGQWEYREQMYGTILRRASVIITGTETGKNEIQRFYQVPDERIKILPFPTPMFALNAPDCHDKQTLEKYKISEHYLFYPAQFWPHKNHAGLLLAVQWLREHHGLIFPIVFVGSDKGNQQHIMKMVAELNLSTQVHFLGFVPQQDLIPLYRNAFALTFVSFFGPDNLPPLEAFALGCPVVASRVSGGEEQLGDAALLVDPKDEEQIALAIKALYDDPALRQTLVQRGLAQATKWTGQDYVKEVFSILDKFESIRRCWSSKEPYHQI